MNNLHINQPQSTSVNSISYISRSQEKEWGKKGSRRKDLSPVILHRLYFTYNNNLLHLYSTFLDTQSALHSGGGSPHPPPVCSIHLDDATAAIVRQNAHHTPAYWWRGDDVMKPISVWGWLGGHDGQRPMGKFGQDARVTPLLFMSTTF